MNALERAAIAGAALYLVVLGLAMQRLSYDIWGGFVMVPVLLLISTPLVRRAFTGPLEPLRPYAWAGMVVKFAGGYVGYQVRFESYGGSADAGRYDAAGKLLSGAVRSGLNGPLSVIPTSQGTKFIEELTGLVYTIFGPSRLGGFMVFSWMSFWGLVFFAKAACTALPRLAKRRYLLFMFLFPSLVYWGSSIGKEAFVGLCLGACTYGISLILARPEHRLTGLLLASAGLIAVARVRPHFAVIWAGAAAIALVWRSVHDFTRQSLDGRARFRLSTLVLVAVATAGFVVVAGATLSYLDPVGQDDEPIGATDRVTAIFESVGSRTSQGGSSFTPINTDNPISWPVAAYRTLTRPLIIEASGLAELLPAVEMTALLIAALIGWRRLLNAPKLLWKSPYLLFAVICLFTFGVGFASIGNLGLLVRQRSLVLPLLLLFWCLPPLSSSQTRKPDAPTGNLRRSLVDARNPAS